MVNCWLFRGIPIAEAGPSTRAAIRMSGREVLAKYSQPDRDEWAAV